MTCVAVSPTFTRNVTTTEPATCSNSGDGIPSAGRPVRALSSVPHPVSWGHVSEYQYYEFRAVDRPLNREELAEVRALSSRAEITSTCFVNVYNWGNFRGKPEELVEKYYDAFLYVANWGTRWVLLRLPLRLVDRDAIGKYCVRRSLSSRMAGDHLILSMYSESISDACEGGSGWLDELLPLRRDLLEGDLRALYLAWLSGLRDQNAAEEASEPPVPPGLGELSEPHDALIRFLRIDRDIVAAAAEGSARVEKTTPSERELSDWIRALPGSEKDEFLLHFLRERDGLAAVELRRRCCQARPSAGQPGLGPAPPARTVGQILRRAEELAEARRLRDADEAARRRPRPSASGPGSVKSVSPRCEGARKRPGSRWTDGSR